MTSVSPRLDNGLTKVSPAEIGTMSDHELLNMGVAEVQDDDVIFMWVTGE